MLRLPQYLVEACFEVKLYAVTPHLQYILVLVSELQMDIVEELVHVGQLQYALVRNHKYQFKLIIQFVLEG